MPLQLQMRAKSLADRSSSWIAWDKDGTCHIFPCKPILRKNAGYWSESGRCGLFQSEEIKFTKHLYMFDDWYKVLIEPSYNQILEPPTRNLYKVTRKF